MSEENNKTTRMDFSRPNLARELSRNTLALVLAGGEGSRLKNLTQRRAKPAVPFGGKYRLLILLYPIASIQAFAGLAF